MSQHQFISPAEADAFASSLLPHQKALLASGETVVERAIMQHNVSAAARVYANVRLSSLAARFGSTPEALQTTVGTMISEGRLKGTIDQLKGVVHFAADQDELAALDRRLELLCTQVQAVAEQCSSVLGQ
jgi:COP9 signalosome complex subunit 4